VTHRFVIKFVTKRSSGILGNEGGDRLSVLSRVGTGLAASGLVAAVLLAGCSSQAAPVRPTTHGPPGLLFSVSFSKPPSLRTLYLPDAEGQALYGTSVTTRSIWSDGTTTVSVDSLTEPVRPGRLPYLLRSYLPSGPNGHRFTKAGDPAMTGIVPACVPSGQCSGFIGGFVILNGQTLYDVTASQSSPSGVKAVLDSFRLSRLTRCCRARRGGPA
jgi:hypothetical protein